MSSLFIRYRTIVSGQEKKKKLGAYPHTYYRSQDFSQEFWLQFSPLPFCDIAPQYLFLWPRSNRFGCAPFRYFILFYFFFDSRIIAGSSCIGNRKRATMCVTYGCHVRSVNASGPSIDSCSHFLSLDISVPFDARAIIRLINIGISSFINLRGSLINASKSPQFLATTNSSRSYPLNFCLREQRHELCETFIRNFRIILSNSISL